MAAGATLNQQWREVFPIVDRLLGLEARARAHELAALKASGSELYPQVATLVQATIQAQDQSFFSDDVALELPPPVSELQPGMAFGAYRIERQIGQGGMGEVWLAQRSDGLYQGKVAIKTLHAHLSRPALRERFTREGQILAKLTHPNIGRLLDAGVAAGGLMFLVLEYIEGERIDQWCDERHLDIAGRLRLFLNVCDAVALAHSHLIVHRDLKPSNILVTGKGEVKLLDFGIAKLLEGTETTSATAEETELTRLGGRALTPEYAAPEQIRGETITTVTDVYALGVLLYEQLCGRRPYGVGASSAMQIEREIVENDARPPSQAVKAGNEIDAQLRATTPDKLARALHGDLDNICQMALKKAPSERYPSVLALRNDLQRYLDHEPVIARGDPFGYRAKKFIGRHKTGVVATAVLALALVAGFIGTFTQEQRAEREAQRAQARADDLRQVVAFQGAMLTRIDVQKLGAGWIERMRKNIADKLDKDHPLPAAQSAQLLADFDQARRWSQPSEVARQSLGAAILEPAQKEIERNFKNKPRVESALRESVAEAYGKLALNDAAMAEDQRAIAALSQLADAATSPEMLRARLLKASILRNQGHFAEAVAETREVYNIRRGQLGAEDPDTLEAGRALTRALYASDDPKGTLAQAEALLPLEQKVLGADDPGTLDTQTMMASVYSDMGDDRKAADTLRVILEAKRRVLGPEDPSTLFTIKLLADSLLQLRELESAEKLDAELLETSRRVYGDGHPQTLGAMTNLASAYDAAGDKVRAFQLYQSAYRLGQQYLDESSPLSQIMDSNYAGVLEDEGRPAEALPIYQTVAALRAKTLGPDKPGTLRSRGHIAHALREMGRYAESRAAYDEVLASQRRVLGAEHRETLQTWIDWAVLLDRSSDAAAAEHTVDELLPILTRLHGEEAAETLSAQSVRGAALCHLHRLDQADALLAATLERQKRVDGAQHPDTLITLSALAETRAAERRPDEALALAQQALDARKTQLGADSPALIPGLKALSAYSLAAGHKAQAAAFNAEASRLESSRAAVKQDS